MQSKSSPRIQQLYADLYRAYTNLQKKQFKEGSDTMITIQEAASDPNYDPAVLTAIRTKMNKAAEDLLKTIKSDKTMFEKVQDQYAAIKAGKTPNAEITDNYKALCKQLGSQHVAYVDDKSKKIVNNAYDLSEALVWGGYAGYLTGAIESEVLIWTLPLAVLASDVGFATVMAPLGVGVAVFALLGLTALALFVANETGVTKRLGKIMAKRYEKKVNEKLTAVLKCINESSRYVENYARKVSGKSDKVNLEAVTDEMKKVVSGFIDDQKSLWSHYTSAEGKEYDEELTDEYGRHKSGLVWKQATAQKSEIGSYKLAVANIWARMVCAC